MSETSARRPWEVPDCPECGGHLFVDKCHTGNQDADWNCHNCERKFSVCDR